MNDIRRITFVHSSDAGYSENQMFGVHFLPVWAYTLAAHAADRMPELSFDLVDDRICAVTDAEAADLFLYSGINQDLAAIRKNRDRLAKRFPESLHAIGGPITWSFQQAGKLEELSVFNHIFVGDGESALPRFLQEMAAGLKPPKCLSAPERFDMRKALPMHRPLLEKTMRRYYGAVIEVSRGCPFLCEFCDVRVLPDNNRSHTKEPGLVVGEIDFFARHGVKQIMLACDNFIGDIRRAEEICDAILRWKKTARFNPGFYTWLTIDLARHPALLQKLRDADFDMLFIGVESFHKNSLLETAKVQNASLNLPGAIRRIQSYGLIVVAGLIFGFDTDPDDIVEITLNGILAGGLISGDPSLLTALPGTPLYQRMKLSNRLRAGKIGLGGFKYQTNIKYLKPAEKMIEDFRVFVEKFNSGKFQYERLKAFYSCPTDSGVAQRGANSRRENGFSHLPALLRVIFKKKKPVILLAKRIARLLCSPDRLLTIGRAFCLTWRLSKAGGPHWGYFKFWLFNWSNSLLKYSRISKQDFDIGTVDEGFCREDCMRE